MVDTTNKIYLVLAPFLGGKDVMVTANNARVCIVHGTFGSMAEESYYCYSRPSEPLWFRTKPYYSEVIYQDDVEKAGRWNYKYPPYLTTDTAIGGSDGSITVFWKKH